MVLTDAHSQSADEIDPTRRGASISHQPSTGQAASPWASGLITFSGAMLVVNGVLQIFIGITALIHDKIYDRTPLYLFAFNLTAWGWIQLITGIAAIGAG